MPPEDLAASDVFTIDGETLRRLLPTIFERCAYSQPLIEDTTRTATATKAFQEQGYFPGSAQIQAVVTWNPAGPGSTKISWEVYDISHGQRAQRVRLTQELGQVLRSVIANSIRDKAAPGQRIWPHNPVVKPGAIFEEFYTGTLYDYSPCATRPEVSDLVLGSLPIGSYAFGFDDEPEITGPELFLSTFRNGAPMEYNGVLVCAPQNSGKTSLIVRWAEAATRNPYAIFLVDVKGNLRSKLEGRLKGEVYCFATDPADETSDRINFLDGPTGLTAADTDRIRQLVTALLPSRGFVETGGLDEYHYRNRVIWLTAFVHILKLAECYYPEWYLDDEGNERNVDLADLYQLIADEEGFYNFIRELQAAEAKLTKRGVDVPVCGVDHWLFELAIMLDKNRVPVGQRPERDSFRTYTTGLLTALEPFSKHGTLHHRVRSFGPGRLFDLETVLGGSERPVTVILAARQQDLQNSTAVLSLAIKRLQWFLFDRMADPEAARHPVLLLLDETRRIRDFDAPEYISFAREAKACCVIVYQSLDQITPAEKRIELLENIGTQIYLGSMVGNTAKSFLSILPQRSRITVSRQIVRTANTETPTLNIVNEKVDYLTSTELYHLPGGRWPALIYINDQPRRAPFFTDMRDRPLERAGFASRPEATAAVTPTPVPQGTGKEFVVGPPRKKEQ